MTPECQFNVVNFMGIVPPPSAHLNMCMVDFLCYYE